MKHLAKSNKKLNRTSAHRKAMLANLSVALLEHGRIKTTLPKAKTLRPFTEKLITLGKKNDLSARRRLISKLRDESMAKSICEEIAPRFSKRNGGYTRILKIGHRYGDAAPMALIELVDYDPNVINQKAKEAEAKKLDQKKLDKKAPAKTGEKTKSEEKPKAEAKPKAEVKEPSKS